MEGYAIAVQIKSKDAEYEDFWVIKLKKWDNCKELILLLQLSYYGMGLVYQKRSDNNEAIDNYRKAARLGNENAKKLLIKEGIKW